MVSIECTRNGNREEQKRKPSKPSENPPLKITDFNSKISYKIRVVFLHVEFIQTFI